MREFIRWKYKKISAVTYGLYRFQNKFTVRHRQHFVATFQVKHSPQESPVRNPLSTSNSSSHTFRDLHEFDLRCKDRPVF